MGKRRFFQARLKIKEKTFTIVIPPPNVTGELHMGHALNATIQDILIRWRRMQGYKTLWLPGTDHAGIATQNVVEKQLKKEGLNRYNLGKEKFIEDVWEWKEKYGDTILKQLKKIGASCDWSRVRFTMDEEYTKAVYKAFIHYYNNGYIYQGRKVVNWCPRCETSLSDLELEYKEEKGKLYYIKYPLKEPSKNRKYIVVATTRPETMFGDSAVAVNPKDERYKDMVGKTVILPLVRREIPIIASRRIDKDFGTGALKVTPAHDILDEEIGEEHNLKKYQVINEEAKMTSLVPEKYQHLSVSECRRITVEDLKKEGLIDKIEDYSHNLSLCYRCGAPIEPLPSKQWFLKMDELAKKAIRAVREKEITFHPRRWEKLYFDWLKNIKDWCISRQIWWGHRLPVWFCQTGRISKSLPRRQAGQSPISKQKYFVSIEKPKQCPICKRCKPEQIPDVLDTWFSSALWPFAILGWPKKTSDLKKFYPTDILSTARDIVNLWVARMIFSSYEFLKKRPFSQVHIHPTVLTPKGKRMSKSLGTGINPTELINKYSADATRFGLIYQNMGSQDIRFNEQALITGKKFSNKIWNAGRFLIQEELNGTIKTRKASPEEKIIKKLKALIKETNQDLENFRFGQALHNLYEFFWHDFCDVYIEEYKKSKKTDLRKNNLIFIFQTSLKLLHPFIPFVTEAVWQKFGFKKSLIISSWPKL